MSKDTTRQRKTARRETFIVSRRREYFAEDELTMQTGYRRRLWYCVIVKEATDNALDNCEEIGVLPNVSVTIDNHGLTVQDNGSGNSLTCGCK